MAVALSWLVKYLPQDIDIQRRLRDEVCAVFGPGSDEDGPLDFETLSGPERVPVLEAVVAESLRCAQIAPNVVRELVNDQVILDTSRKAPNCLSQLDLSTRKSLIGVRTQKAGGQADDSGRMDHLTVRQGRAFRSGSDSAHALGNALRWVK
ncbi:hypothetical protein FRC10_004247 [Ceratobasidium sp. 414]|nr:hypothetical protein FRC10_004247 [Ceratobasidium sp. 414]